MMTTKTTAKQYTDSTIMIITGPKRNGKSLLLARYLLVALLDGRRVWSNMKVHTPKSWVKRGYPKRETEPIDWSLLYALDKELVEGVIGIDEMTYIASNRESLSIKNRLFNSILRQVGHRNLDVYGTARKLSWCDNHVQAEADLEIKMSDLRFSPWGRQNHVLGGTVMRCEYYDLSGAMTGHPCAESKQWRPFRRLKFYGQKYWECYDTKEIVPLEQCFLGVKLDMKQLVIGNRQELHQETADNVSGLVNELVERGLTEINTDAFWEMAASVGVVGDSRSLGRLLPAGVQRRERRGGNIYDFSNYIAMKTLDKGVENSL